MQYVQLAVSRCLLFAGFGHRHTRDSS